MDVYGEACEYSERAMLIYDGLHYDALALAGYCCNLRVVLGFASRRTPGVVTFPPAEQYTSVWTNSTLKRLYL